MTLNIDTPISIYYNDQCFDFDLNLNNSFINNNYFDLFQNFDSLNYYIRVLLIINALFFTYIGTNLIFGTYVHYTLKKNFEIEYNKNKDLYEYDSFLFEYLDEYNDLSDNKLTKDYIKTLKNKFVKVDTKYGTLLMSYDNNSENFNYYTKKSNDIPFEYLDVASRIFVVKYDCKSLYVDNQYIECEKTEAKKSKIFYSYKRNTDKKLEIKVSNKYKYRGSIENFYKLCKFNGYIIKNNTYNDTIFDISNNNSISDISDTNFFFLVKNNSIDIDNIDNIDYDIDFDFLNDFNFFEINESNNNDNNHNAISYKDYKKK